jgi:hypothetical protein
MYFNLASMLVVSCLINNCGIVFGIHIVSYVYQLPMGYAYYCFMFAIVFNFIDWACSLKRFVSEENILFNYLPFIFNDIRSVIGLK